MITFHDISYAQGAYNMDADPCPIVFMKASGFYWGSKTAYFDEQCSRNYGNAIRLNKLPGLYHFAGGADPIAEADHFIKACSPLAENDLLILDYELTAQMNPPADPAEWCWLFVNRVHDVTGVWPLFYTYSSLLNQYGFKKVLEKCALWIANYGVAPENDIPNSPPYIIHQYEGSPLDTNACFVTLETLKKYGYHAISSVPPQLPETPPVAPTPVEIPAPIPVPPAPEPLLFPEAKPSLFDWVNKLIASIVAFLKSYKKG